MSELKTLKTLGNQETLFYHSRNKEIIFMGNPTEKNIKKYDGKRFALFEDLRSEAIKWVKGWQADRARLIDTPLPKEKDFLRDAIRGISLQSEVRAIERTINWIVHFFNLNEGDLK